MNEPGPYHFYRPRKFFGLTDRKYTNTTALSSPTGSFQTMLLTHEGDLFPAILCFVQNYQLQKNTHTVGRLIINQVISKWGLFLITVLCDLSL